MRISVSALMLALNAIAQQRLSLADAVSLALSGNPQLAASGARTESAQGLRTQAGLKPNPRLILQSENNRFGGDPPFSYGRDADTYAYVSQTIETAGKRARRVEVAEAAVQRSQLEAEQQRRQIVARVTAAYWIAVGAARARDLLSEEESNFDRVVQYNRDRVREGATAEVDLLRVEVERQRISVSVQTASLEADQAIVNLFREMGKPEFPAVQFSEPLERPHAVTLITWDEVRQRRPETRIAREAIEQAQANLRLQRANARPDPDAQLGYKRTSGFDTLYAAVQLPLPIRNRNQGQIAAAAADVRVAEASLLSTEALLKAEVATARQQYETQQRLVDGTVRRMRDQAEEVYRIANAAYREGGYDLLRLLDAQRTRLDAQLMYVRTLAEFQRSAAALEAAQGTLP